MNHQFEFAVDCTGFGMGANRYIGYKLLLAPFTHRNGEIAVEYVVETAINSRRVDQYDGRSLCHVGF